MVIDDYGHKWFVDQAGVVVSTLGLSGAIEKKRLHLLDSALTKALGLELKLPPELDELQRSGITVNGDEALAMEVALKAFHSDKLLKTAYQKDLSHYSIDIVDKDGAFRVQFNLHIKLGSPASNVPLNADGIEETMIIDKKSMKVLRIESAG